MTHPYFDLPSPIILGHRGAAGVAPENTLHAFRRGLADGAHIIESDIQITRDGVAMLLHDAEVDRTTDGSGALAGLTLEQAQSLDAAHHFRDPQASGFPMRGQGLRIPTLEQAFEAFPEARFNLEIKGESRALVDQVVDLVCAMKREETTLLTAGEDRVQAMLRESLARTGARPALGASLADILAVVQTAAAGDRPETDSMVLQIPKDFGGRPLVTQQLVAHAHEHGIQVHVWTLNEPSVIREVLDLAVDGIVTDVPGVMAALLAAPDA